MRKYIDEAKEYLNGIVSAPTYAIIISWCIVFIAGFFVGY